MSELNKVYKIKNGKKSLADCNSSWTTRYQVDSVLSSYSSICARMLEMTFWTLIISAVCSGLVYKRRGINHSSASQPPFSISGDSCFRPIYSCFGPTFLEVRLDVQLNVLHCQKSNGLRVDSDGGANCMGMENRSHSSLDAKERKTSECIDVQSEAKYDKQS